MIANLKDLPTMIGKSDSLDYAIDRIIRDPLRLDNISSLSKYFKIRIKFSKPIEVHCSKKYIHIKDVSTGWTHLKPIQHIGTEHIFNGLFNSCGRLCYTVKKDGRTGYQLSMSDILEYEPVLESVPYFTSLEEFKKKFDTLFITDKQIEELWNEKSSQTGAHYDKNDFRSLGKRGHEVMKRFLGVFKGVTSTDSTGYADSQYGGKIFIRNYDSWHHSGRDITIEHKLGNLLVHYSTEYHGCGNGRYGLVANRSEYLHLEDD